MKLRAELRATASALTFLICAALAVPAQQPVPSATPNKLAVSVVDENGVAVTAAHVLLTARRSALRCESDFAGRCEFNSLQPGTYKLHVEKVGFYRLDFPEVRFPQTNSVDVTLTHEQELKETVNVVESPPAIDPEKVETSEILGAREILNVPYPTSRDIRNALPLLPGVVMDRSGAIHVAGASATQTLSLLDGFDISSPASGFLDMRVNVDTLRSIDVDSSRYSAQFGRGNNLIGLNTGMGDDRLRFSATNFFPSFQNRKGLHFNQWVPRATISGPIKRGKIWFYDGPEAEYDLTIVKELPDGADRATSWRTGNLTKLQANLTNSNILSSEFVVNNLHAPHSGLSAINPLETTSNVRSAAYMGALKDQQYFKSGTLLEYGIAIEDFSASSQPLGNLAYQISPSQPSGSFFEAVHGSARRWQWITNVFLPPQQWHGRHEFKIGMDADRLSFHRRFVRSPIAILREDGTLARQVQFLDGTRVNDVNLQTSWYAQDRWSPVNRLLIESGVRMDWDEILRNAVFAPRFGGTYVVDSSGRTKLSAGIGLFFSATNLDLVTRPFTGSRLDYVYAPDGVTLLGPPVLTEFIANEHGLRQPRSLNWSLGLEQTLPAAVYLRVDYLQRRWSDALVYANLSGPQALLGTYVLTNGRQDNYDSITFTVRHTFRNVYPLMIAYTRSSARTNALIDFNVDSPVLAPQQEGKLPWDAPNRIVAWGWFPFVKKFSMGYSLEWRDGFPFSIVNQDQVIVGQADANRFPRYFTLGISGERRFHIAGVYLALRGTLENITNQRNANSVVNNINAPNFLQFSGLGHRVFTGRIRFLGRSKTKADATQTPPTPQSKP